MKLNVLLSTCGRRWLVFEKPALALKSNFGLKAALRLVRKLSDWNASGCVHSSRSGVPSESSVSLAKPGIWIGPSSLRTSPETKKRTASEPPAALHAHGVRVAGADRRRRRVHENAERREAVERAGALALGDQRAAQRADGPRRRRRAPSHGPTRRSRSDTCCCRRPCRPHHTTSSACRRRDPSWS